MKTTMKENQIFIFSMLLFCLLVFFYNKSREMLKTNTPYQLNNIRSCHLHMQLQGKAGQPIPSCIIKQFYFEFKWGFSRVWSS